MNAYLEWMARNTPTEWCNDSALLDRVRAAIAAGAVGCTTNPPLSFQALSETPSDFRDAIAAAGSPPRGDGRAETLVGAVVRTIAALFRDRYEQSGGRHGYVRAQVQPSLSRNGTAMLEMGLRYAAIAPNIMVKIPASTVGVDVLEELAYRGVPTTPTICITVSQMIAVAEAHERGCKRAMREGRAPAASTAAIVFGRTQDYLALLNEQRGAGLAAEDLELAAIAVAKRCHAVFRERGYRQLVMPAAFRTARQVAELAGGTLRMTIRPGIQDDLDAALIAGTVARTRRIDAEVDPAILRRVAAALPEFTEAYEPDGLPVSAFDRYPGLIMTLESFDRTGWQRLRDVALPSGN